MLLRFECRPAPLRLEKRSLWKCQTSNRAFLAAALCLGFVAPVHAQVVTSALIEGIIDVLQVDDPGDTWSGGRIVVAGQTVIIPRNLIVQLPANFLTLQQIFSQAPTACGLLGESGLATDDDCLLGGVGGLATIHANRMATGDVIAGEVDMAKPEAFTMGTISFINYANGYFRVNGLTGSDTTGVMVRVNDPETRHTIQQGLGCTAESGPNCSADPRFTGDPDNYTFTYTTGYPACIPSTVASGGNRTVGSDAAGVGDPFCPQTNRSVDPVPDSTRFAPIKVGDTVVAIGNFEVFGGVKFFSGHTITVSDKLNTNPNDPTQPDYMTFFETAVSVAGYEDRLALAEFIGFHTGAPDLDIYSLNVDPATNVNHEVIMASTFNNPLTVNRGIGAGAGGIFSIFFEIDFVTGPSVPAGISPCTNLASAGFFSACSFLQTMEDEFSILTPVPREIIGRTRHKVNNPTLEAFDIRGLSTRWGEYLSPIGIHHVAFLEVNLAATEQPFIFTGEPWLLDRRLSPGGCVGPCESTPQPLDPFPFSGLDPRTQASTPGVPLGARDRILSAWGPSGPATVLLPWPPATPGPLADTLGTLTVRIKRATFKTDNVGTFIDVWASDKPGTVLTVTGTGVPATVMNGDGTGTFFAHINLAGGAPSFIRVTNIATGASASRTLVDEVFVTGFDYDPLTGTLSVAGSASTPAGSSALTLCDGTPMSAAGQVDVAVGTVPPLTVCVDSPDGGSLDLPVTVLGCEALGACAATASAAVCEWCVFDHNQNGFTDGLDFGFFSGCFGTCYPAGHACLAANYDQDPGGCVGGGDFGALSGCFGLDCDGCPTGLCFGPAPGIAAVLDPEDDLLASVQVIALDRPSTSDFADVLPESNASFNVRDKVYLEVWASTLDATTAGLASVYADLSHDEGILAFDEAIPSKAFEVLARVSEPGGSVGGCAPLGDGTLGTDAAWVRVATVRMRAQAEGAADISTGPSDAPYGVSLFGRYGDLDPSQIEYGTVQLTVQKNVGDGQLPKMRTRKRLGR